MADDTLTVIIDDTGLGTEFGTIPFIATTTISEPANVVRVEDIGNVDSTGLTDGALLVYKTTTNKWTATKTLEAQTMEGGFF
jgi:hypothetical protein